MKMIRKHFDQKIEIQKIQNALEKCSLHLVTKQSAYPTRTIKGERPYPLVAIV